MAPTHRHDFSARFHAVKRVFPRFAIFFVAYGWLVAQAFLPVLQSRQDARQTQVSVVAATAIEAPHARHCVHHPVACPPDCHCPPLDDDDSDQVSQGGNDDLRSGSPAGTLRYSHCDSGSALGLSLGDMPPHGLNLAAGIFFGGNGEAFPSGPVPTPPFRARDAADKVPIRRA